MQGLIATEVSFFILLFYQIPAFITLILCYKLVKSSLAKKSSCISIRNTSIELRFDSVQSPPFSVASSHPLYCFPPKDVYFLK